MKNMYRDIASNGIDTAQVLVKITENGEYVPTRVGEVMERRRLRARANFEEAVERRRLPSCYPSSFYVYPRYDSEKECRNANVRNNIKGVILVQQAVIAPPQVRLNVFVTANVASGTGGLDPKRR